MDTVLIDNKNIMFFAPYIPQQLIKQLASPDWMALGAVEEGTAISALVTYYATERLSLEWLYVTPERRRRGVANSMLDTLQNAVKNGNTRMITASFDHKEYGRSLCALLEKCGFEYPEEDVPAAVYETPLASLKLDGLRASSAHKKSVILLPNVPAHTLNRLSQKLADLPVAPSLLPLRKADYLPCSTAFVSAAGIKGICLLRGGDEFIELSYLYALQPQMLLPMLLTSFEQLKHYPQQEQTTLRLWALTDSARRLADKLLPQASVKPLTIMAYIF